MGSFKITDKDNGFSAFFRGVKGLAGPRVKVGIQGKEAAKVREGGISMVQLGTIHEFGAPRANIPQRSYLRSTADEKKRKYVKFMEGSVRRLIRSPERFNAKATLFQLGETVRSDVIKKIKSNIPPPLKPATIARKGESIALIDTGLLLSSIRSVVS